MIDFNQIMIKSDKGIEGKFIFAFNSFVAFYIEK